MKFHVILVAALCSNFLMLPAAMPADIPRSGVFKIHSTANGSSRFVTIGKGDSHLDIWEEGGKVEGDGPLSNMTTRCFGIGETSKAINETSHGRCVHRDADGDHIVYEVGIEKHNQERSLSKGWGRALLGTGKFEGINASYVVACELLGPSSGYTYECKGQGSYILP